MEKGLYEIHDQIGSDFPFKFYTELFHDDYSIPNWHSNIEILCCIKGRGILNCQSASYEFLPGDIAVINSDILHTVISDSEISYHFLIIDDAFFHQNDLPLDAVYFQEFIRDPQLFDAFSQIAQSFSEDGPLMKASCKHSVLTFLLLLYRNYASKRQSKSLNPENTERIKEIIKYINSNLFSRITLDMIADAVGINKYYLSHEFKKYTNSTVFEHINLLRCYEAKRLIQDGMSVSAAALSCGFENVSYFTKVYKKHMGSLPSEAAAK